MDDAIQTAQPVPLLEVPCACGALDCRGTITGDDWRLPGVRAKYAGHFAPFINRRIEAPGGRSDVKFALNVA